MADSDISEVAPGVTRDDSGLSCYGPHYTLCGTKEALIRSGFAVTSWSVGRHFATGLSRRFSEIWKRRWKLGHSCSKLFQTPASARAFGFFSRRNAMKAKKKTGQDGGGARTHAPPTCIGKSLEFLTATHTCTHKAPGRSA